MSRHAEHYESGLDTFAGAHYSTGGNVGSVALIGGGPGDAGLITVRGLELLYAADVVVADRLGPRSLLDELADDVLVIDVGKHPGHHPVPRRWPRARQSAERCDRCGRRGIE